MAGFKGGNGRRLLENPAQFVDSFEKTGFGKRVYRELDALAIVCKAADFERSLFLTFAVLVLDRDADAMGRAKQYGDLYAELPKESAQRTLRFWRMRRQAPELAA